MSDTLNVKVGDRVAWKVRTSFSESRWIVREVTNVTKTGRFTAGGVTFNKNGIKTGKGDYFSCRLLTDDIARDVLDEKRRDIAVRIIDKFQDKLAEIMRESHKLPLEVLEKIAVSVDGVLE